MNELHVFRQRFFNYANKMQRSNAEHRAIVDAMLSGNADLAEQLAEQHVLAGKQRLLENMDGFDFIRP